MQFTRLDPSLPAATGGDRGGPRGRESFRSLLLRCSGWIQCLSYWAKIRDWFHCNGLHRSYFSVHSFYLPTNSKPRDGLF